MSKPMSEMTFGEWLKELATAAVVGAIMSGIIFVFLLIADAIVPKRKDGTTSGKLTAIVAVLLLAGVCTLLNFLFFTPPYHPIVDASPGEVRSMMYRKCIVQHVDLYRKPDAELNVYCAALDGPDLPKDQQGLVLQWQEQPSADAIMTRNNLKYEYSGTSMLASQLLSDDPKVFRSPYWYYKDGTRPSKEKYFFF